MVQEGSEKNFQGCQLSSETKKCFVSLEFDFFRVEFKFNHLSS